MNIWQKLEKYPPVLVRLLAKHEDNRTAMSDSDICSVSQGALGIADVKRLSYLTHWTEVTVHDMQFFCLACGVDFGDREKMRNLNRYMIDAKFSHLKRDKNFPHFKELLKVYLQSLTQ